MRKIFKGLGSAALTISLLACGTKSSNSHTEEFRPNSNHYAVVEEGYQIVYDESGYNPTTVFGKELAATYLAEICIVESAQYYTKTINGIETSNEVVSSRISVVALDAEASESSCHQMIFEGDDGELVYRNKYVEDKSTYAKPRIIFEGEIKDGMILGGDSVRPIGSYELDSRHSVSKFDICDDEEYECDSSVDEKGNFIVKSTVL